MKYSINLVRQARVEEHKAEKIRVRLLALTAAGFGVLVLALFYGVLQILDMQSKIRTEEENLSRIQAEYRKYQETKMIIDKADIELLSGIQTRRIYWTKKLASMALHLPDNYWITKFGYDRNLFSVVGYGYISNRQEQLITLDDYLNSLRADSLYNDVFRTSYLKSTVRTDEGVRERVSFEYVSLSRGTTQQ
jgi:Tfp pilus assembly protein PilN